MEVQDNEKNVILVNRGWVPLQYVQQKKPWNRPTEIVDIVGIVSSTERKCIKLLQEIHPLLLFIYYYFLNHFSLEYHINIIILYIMFYII